MNGNNILILKTMILAQKCLVVCVKFSDNLHIINEEPIGQKNNESSIFTFSKRYMLSN
jgi:hypothetical protein